MATLLNTQGSTPNTNPLNGMTGYAGMISPTAPPAAKALSSSALPNLGTLPSTNPIAGGTNTSTPAVAHSTPTTPLASLTTTDVAGNTTKSTYVSPTTSSQSSTTTASAQSPTTPIYDPTTGFLTDYGKSIGAKSVQPGDPANTAPTQTNTPTPPPTGTVFSNGQNVPAPTFTGLLGGASNQASTLNTQAGLINQTAAQIGAETQMSPAEQQANANAANLAKQAAAALGDVGTQGWSAAFQEGQEGLINRNINAQEAAQEQVAQTYAAQREANATALGAESTAQTGAGGLQSSAGGILNSAASTAAPQVTSPGQAVFNPTTGTYTSASSGGAPPTTAPSGIDQTSWNQYVQDMLSGNVNAIPSNITGNANLSGQLQAAAQAQNPNFNYNTALGQGAAAQSNAETGGTAAVNAAQSAYVNAYPAVQQLNQAVNNISSLGNMTVQNAQGNNINPFAAAPANATLAQIRIGLSSTGQVTFNSNITQLQQAIQSLYANSGGNTPTGVQSAITQMADGSLSVGGLQALLTAAESEGALLLGNAKATASSEFSATQGGGGSSTATPATSGWASLGD